MMDLEPYPGPMRTPPMLMTVRKCQNGPDGTVRFYITDWEMRSQLEDEDPRDIVYFIAISHLGKFTTLNHYAEAQKIFPSLGRAMNLWIIDYLTCTKEYFWRST